MNKEFFMNSRSRIGETMADDSILVLFAGTAPVKSADEDYPFTPNRNFFYMTGISRDKMILMMIKKQGKVEERLFIEKADPELEKWIGKRMTEAEAKEISGIQQISFLENFEGSFNQMLYAYDYNYLYLDLERGGYTLPQTKTEEFAKLVNTKYPQIRVKNIYHKICRLRTIKTEAEVETIKKAIAITKEGIMEMMKNARPGMIEYEIEAYFDFTLKRRGVKDYAFKTITAAGKNATVLHYTENDTKVNDNELVLLDLGAQVDFYNADISRTFPVNGKFTERQKIIYNIVLKALEESIKAIKTGITLRELNETTKKVLAEGLMEIGLIKEEAEVARYYYHGVSHPLGMDTHDVGSRDMLLKPGMVITIEPGLYIEEEAIGIRIEDDVLVKEDGVEVLSKDIIRTAEEIEEYIKSAR